MRTLTLCKHSFQEHSHDQSCECSWICLPTCKKFVRMLTWNICVHQMLLEQLEQHVSWLGARHMKWHQLHLCFAALTLANRQLGPASEWRSITSSYRLSTLLKEKVMITYIWVQIQLSLSCVICGHRHYACAPWSYMLAVTFCDHSTMSSCEYYSNDSYLISFKEHALEHSCKCTRLFNWTFMCMISQRVEHKSKHFQ